ncbi:cytochrome P450 [Rhizophagus irregularis]|uniref:Cytochrome P450 n=1 Tax=Rhizophagus irregularis TaxID=588596 RepID=A0A2N0PAA0_9GLOM|nr:cytochrome P450 [Rhizophagus irregularis]
MASLNIIGYLLYNLNKIIPTLIIAYIFKYYLSWYTRENPIPGPIPLPLIGNLHQIGKDLGKEAIKLQKKYGDIFEVMLGPSRVIFISRAELMEKICSPALKNNVFAYRSLPNAGLDEMGLSKSGISFNMDLEGWKFNRRVLSHTIMSPIFLRENINFVNQIFDELENYWINLLKFEKKIDFTKWSSYAVTDIILTSITGKKSYSTTIYYNSLSNSIETEVPDNIINESLKFIDSIYMFLTSFLFFYIIPPFIRHNFPFIKSIHKKYEDNVEWLDTEFEKVIKKRKQEIENSPVDQPLEHNILNLLITINTERDINKISGIDYMRPMNDVEIRDTIKEIFSAGADTVIYTEAVISEVARLKPAVPVFLRATSLDTEIGGYKIKKGTQIFTNYIGVHMHEDHWNEPEKFNPDRFLNYNIVKNSLLNFGGGIRICPGRHWAIKNLKILLIRLLTKFDMTLVDPDSPLKSEFKSVEHCNELEIYVKERE